MNYVLLVDDEPGILHALQRLLTRTPCSYDGQTYPLEIIVQSDPVAALEYVRHHSLDLIVSDYRMPEMDGVTFLSACRALQPECARLILSGYADLNTLICAINEAQIYRFICKPWNDYELVSAIAQALAYRKLMLENQRLADEARLQKGMITPEEAELRRLEAAEPGLTKVNWGPDGSVLLDGDL